MNGPSEHLSWKELACRDRMRTTYPMDWRTDPTRLPRLCAAFEAVRAIWGQPIPIDSAYRTRAHHRAIYKTLGQPAPMGSQHLEGRALDMRPPEGVTVWTFFEAIVALAKARPELGIRYVKGYFSQGFVHMDVRPGERVKVEWDE